jgi:FSR family fosmidomycin resistance protein-like MFS transporter
MKRLLLPSTLGLAHGIADGAAGLMLGGLPARLDLQHVALLVLLYNVLAFACQPLFGVLTDRLGRPRAVALLGLALQAAGLLALPLNATAAVTLAGLGSGCFHVGGGALALCATRGRATGPGLFAAPGVVGLALGGYLAITGASSPWPWLALLAAVALAITTLRQPALPYAQPAAEPAFERHDLIMIALLAGIALRSLVWTTLQYALQARVDVLLLLGIAGALGKVAGGVLADRLGWRRWTLLALGAAAALLTAGAGHLWVLLLGVALLQSATPGALAATLRLLPRQPATAAGLGLGLAIAAGGLPLAVGWGAALRSPPALAALAIGAGVLCALALTWLRRPASRLRAATTPA